MNDTGGVCKEKFRIAENMEKTGYEILYYLFCAVGAAADKTREKSDITPKLDMMSMRNDVPHARRTIQVA